MLGSAIELAEMLMQAGVTPTGQKDKWKVMAAVAMGIFLATIDGSIVNIAMPTLETSLNTEFALVQWVVLAYLLTVTTLMLGIGRLADMFGKKPLYTAGLVIFTLGSLLCGLSTSIYALIAFRVFQAVGAAMLMALGTAIVTEAFPASERGRALGIAGTLVSLGVIAGPTMGGLILKALTWHWIFFVNLPVGIVGLFMVLRFVPAKKPAGGERFDFRGAVLLFLTLISFLVALTAGQKIGFGNPLVLGLLAASAVLLVIFIQLEARLPHPMIDLTLFRRPLFSINLLTGILTFICSAGTIFLMPFYLQNVLGYSPSQVGLLMAVMPLSMGITAPISGTLSDRIGTRPMAVIGLGMLLLGYTLVSTLRVDTNALGYILRFLPVGIGMGLFQSPNNSAVMGSSPPNRLGISSGLLSITRTLGQTIGISILGTVWASVVTHSGELLPGTEVTTAPAQVQVAALNLTSGVIIGLIAIALGLSVWALVLHKRQSHPLEAPASPTQVARQRKD